MDDTKDTMNNGDTEEPTTQPAGDTPAEGEEEKTEGEEAAA